MDKNVSNVVNSVFFNLLNDIEKKEFLEKLGLYFTNGGIIAVSGNFPSGCIAVPGRPLVYVNAEGKDEILTYFDPGRKNDICGIFSGGKVVALEDEPGKFNYDQAMIAAEEFAKKTGAGWKLPDYPDGMNFFLQSEEFSATVTFLRSQGKNADVWQQERYYWSQTLVKDRSFACRFNMRYGDLVSSHKSGSERVRFVRNLNL